MIKKEFIVRTIYLQKFFDPGQEMVAARSNLQDRDTLIKAMRRLEMADQTLERELNSFTEKGYDIATLLEHPRQNDHDLLVTLILSKDID